MESVMGTVLDTLLPGFFGKEEASTKIDGQEDQRLELIRSEQEQDLWEQRRLYLETETKNFGQQFNSNSISPKRQRNDFNTQIKSEDTYTKAVKHVDSFVETMEKNQNVQYDFNDQNVYYSI